MKKLIPIIGLYFGAFIVLNVGMFFMLKFTQPKTDALTDGIHPDSVGVLLGDSTMLQDDAEFDHEPDAVVEDAHSEDGKHADKTEGTSKSATTDTSRADSETNKPEQVVAEHASAVSEALDSVESADDFSTEAIEPGVALNDTPKSSIEIAKLAKVLEGMKPGEAAIIAERLPTETIVELVMRMKSRNGAKMMASLPVPVAASVATRMAELSGVRKPS